ncbi:nuclear transport factor 2 [Crepidotus variabilis]|uniref:Nuclear transport factor 2 n=1 Tax=Crepidotus variabilis TaxID=179855 RepID=A0A9P6EQZ4_9AGAR|nr:nuclear transport factor 2 [Crepidotus variabilis]
MAADIVAIAKQFTDFYYSTFDTNRASLGSLYRDTSMLTWEGQPIQGRDSISEKLTSLPFASVQHKVTTSDVQPIQNGIVVYVTGLLVVDDSTNPLQFGQVFNLTQEGDSFFIQNDIFRLNYG